MPKEFASNITVRRNKVLSKYIDIKTNKGLEIGPLHEPQIDASIYNVKYADLQNKAGLMEYYRNDPNVPLEKIPNIDYVIEASSPADAIGEIFDYIVANHVLEHCPNPISYLEELSKLLRKGGILFMAIPDKKFTFDKDRPLTTFDHIIGDYFEHATSVDFAHIFEFERIVESPQCHLEEVLHRALERIRNWKKVMHMHYHVFSCESFREILNQVLELRLLDFGCKFLDKTSENSCEFYVVLRKCDTDSKREAMPIR
ncbi:MAG: methyltransferase domain-containing protein [Puniceicoccales bacterium]|nr:methyltransferase domain-containing protein [Puniceicoccales bacterium]